jgi:hypothetical protein
MEILLPVEPYEMNNAMSKEDVAQSNRPSSYLQTDEHVALAVTAIVSQNGPVSVNNVSVIEPHAQPLEMDAVIAVDTTLGNDPGSSCEVGGAGVGCSCHSSDISSVKLFADHQQQLLSLADAVKLLMQTNEELQQTVAAGSQKIITLEAAFTAMDARNNELEKEVARLSVASEQATGEIAVLSSGVTQLISEHGQKTNNGSQPVVLDDKNKTADGTEPTAAEPTAEQRITELERRSEQSLTRFTEFASTLEHIERDLQRYLRRHSLIIENLCPKEDRSASDTFLVFVNSVLGVTADESDIDGLHLVDRPHSAAGEGGTQSTGGSSHNSPVKTGTEHRPPRPVLITFTCFRTRTRVYKAWLSYRVGASGGGKVAAGALSGERGQGVCIREYLTAEQEALYRSAIDVRHRRPDVVIDCWTFRGRTFIRTAQGDVREFTEDLVPKDGGKSSSCVVM